jgi:predicted dehydrogenase
MVTAKVEGSRAPIRFGVIGAGWFASRRHLPDMQNHPEVTLAAICRRDPEAGAKMAQRFGLTPEQTFADWQQMLDCVELDAVLIATPNALHYEQAKQALERGLHVLLEKPMALRGAEAWELVALAREKQRQLAVTLNPPFWAHTHRVRNALHSEVMGSLESVAIYWSGSAEYVFGRAPRPENLPGVVPPTMFRADPTLNGGGYFIDGGTHLVSELLWTTGLRARRVSALMDTLPTDMRAVISIELENGVVASINTIGDSKYPGRRVHHVFGAVNGVVTVNTFDFKTEIRVHGDEPRIFKEHDLPQVSQPVANFVNALRGQEALFSPGEHGAQVVEVVEAAYESARSGRTVCLSSSQEFPEATNPQMAQARS